MRWTPNGLSKNFEDRRNEAPVEPLPPKDDRVMAHESPIARPAMQVRYVGETEDGMIQYEDGRGNRFTVPKSVVGTARSGVAYGPPQQPAGPSQADIERYQREFEAAQTAAPERTPMALPEDDDGVDEVVVNLRKKLGLL
jgi:hypothetical protein